MTTARNRMRLGMFVVAAGVSLLAACATDADDNAASAQSELTAAPDQGQAATPTDDHAASGTDPAKPVAVGPVAPQVACRLVTAASIPVFTTTTGGTVSCTFFRGDRFSYFGQVIANGRLVTWCPRGVPPAQGRQAYAQLAGTGPC